LHTSTDFSLYYDGKVAEKQNTSTLPLNVNLLFLLSGAYINDRTESETCSAFESVVPAAENNIVDEQKKC
jgi:hypothetical protein